MYKTTIVLIVIAVLCIGALLYFIPWQTNIDLTLQATKLDKEGNDLGTAEITIQGAKYDYLMQSTAIGLDITIEGNPVQFNTDGYPRRDGTELGDLNLMGCYSITLTGIKDNQVKWLLVYISPDLTRWMLYDYDGEAYYVGSVNKTDSAQSLWDYFSLNK